MYVGWPIARWIAGFQKLCSTRNYAKVKCFFSQMKSALRFQRHASVLSIKIRPKSTLKAGLKSCKKLRSLGCSILTVLLSYPPGNKQGWRFIKQICRFIFFLLFFSLSCTLSTHRAQRSYLWWQMNRKFYFWTNELPLLSVESIMNLSGKILPNATEDRWR